VPLLNLSHSDYCTAARTEDGSYVVACMPTARTITVNMKSLKGAATAEWFDPTDGTYRIIPGRFANKGSRQFTPPDKNHEGASDWVFMLEVSGYLGN
jgi:Putative collagen-binding domain of a collagenase